MSLPRKVLAAFAVAALALPAAAIASTSSGVYTQVNGHKHGNKSHKGGNHKNPVVTYVFKGTFNGSSAYTVESSMHVYHGNRFVRKQGFLGQDVSFDLTNAKVVVADNNADGVSNLTDVLVGDTVVVKARLHKKTPGPEPFTAKKLVDQTHPPAATP
jgi:hypothetical protein